MSDTTRSAKLAALHAKINALPDDALEPVLALILAMPLRPPITWGELLRRFDVVTHNGDRLVTIGEREQLLEALR